MASPVELKKGDIRKLRTIKAALEKAQALCGELAPETCQQLAKRYPILPAVTKAVAAVDGVITNSIIRYEYTYSVRNNKPNGTSPS